MTLMLIMYGRVISAYLLSFSAVTMVLVYGIDLPTMMTGERKLVTEYYYKDFVSSLLTDVLVVAGYLGVAAYTISAASVKGLVARLAVVAITAAIISGSFLALFSLGWYKETFFSRWFEASGRKAVAYDIALVTSVYWLLEFIEKLIAHRLVLNT